MTRVTPVEGSQSATFLMHSVNGLMSDLNPRCPWNQFLWVRLVRVRSRGVGLLASRIEAAPSVGWPSMLQRQHPRTPCGYRLGWHLFPTGTGAFRGQLARHRASGRILRDANHGHCSIYRQSSPMAASDYQRDTGYFCVG